MKRSQEDISAVSLNAWDQELQQVRKLKDGLGMPVDAGIEALVAALRLLGFDTVASCEGHPDRATGGPYVMVQSSEAQRTFRAQQKLADPSTAIASELLRLAHELNLREGHKLELLLDQYYQTQSVTWGQVLEVRSVGYAVNRLCFIHSESDQLLSGDARVKRLKLRQDEMMRFTRFLGDEILGLGDPENRVGNRAA